MHGAIIDAGNDCVSTYRLHRVSVDWLDRLLSGIVRLSTIDAEIVLYWSRSTASWVNDASGLFDVLCKCKWRARGLVTKAGGVDGHRAGVRGMKLIGACRSRVIEW